MSKGNLRALERANPLQAQPRRLTIPVNGVELTVDGDLGVNDATAVIGWLPRGIISIVSATANLAFAGPGSDANLSDTWSGDFAIGSAANANVTLTGTDQDIVPSTAIGPAVAESIASTLGISTPVAGFDNTAGTSAVNLNLLVDDGNATGSGAIITATGVVDIMYVVMAS